MTKDKIYVVVEISNEILRVVNDNYEPILYPMDAFETVDDNLGSDWIVSLCPDNEFYITRKSLSKQYFFEDLFDYKEECVTIWRKFLIENNIRI